MLNSQRQYERAVAEVARLEARVKAGTATPAERRRAYEGALECICWEWEKEGREQRERIERARERAETDQPPGHDAREP